MTTSPPGAAVDTLGKRLQGVALRSARGPPSVQRPGLLSYRAPRDANLSTATGRRCFRITSACPPLSFRVTNSRISAGVLFLHCSTSRHLGIEWPRFESGLLRQISSGTGAFCELQCYGDVS